VQQEEGSGRRRTVTRESVVPARAERWPEQLVALYSAERTALVRAAFLISGSAAAAEDAVHDALTRVASRWDRVDNGRSYLYVAVVNAARDGARREYRARQSMMHGVPAAGDDLAGLSADSMQLRAALVRLPVNQRAAIVLRFFLDWDDDEIALHFGVRPATVRSWVHRGVTRIRRDWKR
jgi:RNA polymerase sigma factor (sigma-70 family)